MLVLWIVGLVLVLAGIVVAVRSGNDGQLLVAAGNAALTAYNALVDQPWLAAFHGALVAFSLTFWVRNNNKGAERA